MARQGFSFLVSPDSALMKEELERQIKDWPHAKREVFWGDEEPPKSFWESLQQPGLFADKRVLVVRQAENWAPAIWKSLSQILARSAEHIWPFFCLEVSVEKGSFKIPAHIKNASCFQFASKQGWVWYGEGLGKHAQDFVKSHAARLGLSIPSDLLGRLCGSTPPDAQSLLNELQKLALLAKDGKVTLDIMPDGSASLESDAFKLINQIWGNNLPAVWKEVSNDVEGNLLFFVIALLSRELRLLWQILQGENPRVYQFQQKKALATKLGFSGLARGFAALAEAEWQVKSGRFSPAQALEVLVMTFGRLASGSSDHASPLANCHRLVNL